MAKPIPSDWSACPAGEWQKLSTALRFRHRISLALQIFVLVLATTTVALGAWRAASWLSASFRANQEPASCHPVVEPGCGDPSGTKP